MNAIDFLRNLYELIGKFLETQDEETPIKEEKLINKETPVFKKKNPFNIINHVLYRDGKKVRFEETSKYGGKFKNARFIINHYTANDSTEGTIRTFKNHPVSAHLVVDHDGEVVQMVPFNKKAWHCGKSSAKSKWGTRYTGLNSYSIGIEFVNLGYYRNAVKNKNVDWEEAIHKNEGFLRKWEPYTKEQIIVAEQLNEALCKHYKLPAEHILGHDEISPDRKVDPGPLFPIDMIRSKLGARK